MNNHTIITISRQLGSGGKEVAEIVAKKLGVRCYDRQILYIAAEKAGSSNVDVESLLNDAYQSSETSKNSIGENGFYSASYYNKMYKEQAKMILDIANKESAVFVGRCADAVLTDKPGCYSIYIYADDAYRAERAKKYYGNKTLKELDKENAIRKYYYKHYTGKKWGVPENYDLMINTSNYSLEDAADLIIEYVKQRQQQ